MGNKRSNQIPDSRGFSLVEILVVIAVIAILAGILFPVMARAKRDAYRAADISNLRQFAVAQSLYTQNYGRMAFGVPTLVKIGYVKPPLCVDGLDPFKVGLGNETALFTLSVTDNPQFKLQITPYKRSYTGWNDYFSDDDYTALGVENQSEAGWLIDIFDDPLLGHIFPTDRPPISTPEYVLFAFDTYLRLENDGSVVFKHKDFGPNCKAATNEKCSYLHKWSFADGDSRFYGPPAGLP